MCRPKCEFGGGAADDTCIATKQHYFVILTLNSIISLRESGQPLAPSTEIHRGARGAQDTGTASQPHARVLARPRERVCVMKSLLPWTHCLLHQGPGGRKVHSSRAHGVRA